MPAAGRVHTCLIRGYVARGPRRVARQQTRGDPAMAEQVIEFEFRWNSVFRLAALPFGVRPDSALVCVVDDELIAAFGPWHVRTPLSNVAAASATGDYWWPKVIGPAHLSLSDGGLTFASNPDAGVCIRFHEPVRGIEPLGLLRHRSLTVTVADVAGLVELLDRSTHDERRTHTPDDPTVVDLLAEVHDDLTSLTAAELRRRARDRGLEGVSRRSKAELIDLLEPSAAEPRSS